MKKFTSDIHHRHKRIVELTNRGYDTTSEKHDEWLVDIWNMDVSKHDEVWHLGDFSFSSKYLTVADFVQKLNGNINLIKGNHDNPDILTKLQQDGLINNWWDYKEIKIGEQKVCLFHFPIMVWPQQHRGSWHLHGHCVDDATEILTEKGWKKFGEFGVGDLVYSYNHEKNCNELTPIYEIISQKYTGKVYENNGKSVNFRVTEDHTMVYWYNGEFIEKSLKDIKNSIRISLITASEGNAEGVSLTDDELRLYICIAADGSVKTETNLCRIRVKKPHKISYLRALFGRLKITAREYTGGSYISFNFYVPEQFTGWNFKGLDTKLLRVNKQNCEVIMDAYCHSDGHKQTNGVIIYSQKENEIDLLQQIFTTNGFMSTKYMRKHGFGSKIQFQLSVTNNTRQIMRKSKLIVSNVVDEHFWCIKTKNQSFMIRRYGKVSVTGNCHGNLKVLQGKMLDVGLDSAYNLLGSHRFFTEEDIVEHMKTKEIQVLDHHEERNATT